MQINTYTILEWEFSNHDTKGINYKGKDWYKERNYGQGGDFAQMLLTE